MAGRIIGVIALTVLIFILNYIGIPGYIVALAIGFIGSLSLLRRNQNGKIREKLALLASVAISTVAYLLISGQAYGVYAGAVVFLAASFGLTHIYKSRMDNRLWFSELLPSILRFVLFERIGGAISGLGYQISMPLIHVSVRYIEAFVLLIAFCVLQSKISKYLSLASMGKYGQREYYVPRHRKLMGFVKFATVVVLVVVWFNPANTLLVDNIKNSVLDSLTDVGGVGDSTVEVISDTNGTSLLVVKSDNIIVNEQGAFALLTSYDKNLGGEFAFKGSEKLLSGDTVYNFAQTSNGIPIYGGSKKLVVGLDNKPLYIVGTTKIGANNLAIPKGTIGASQARNSINGYFDGDGVVVGTAVKTWSVAQTNNTTYNLTYSVPVSSDYGDGLAATGNIIVDAISGDIVDIRSFTNGQHDSLTDIFRQIKDKGDFIDIDFESIIKSTDIITKDVDVNAWLYRDILMQECEKYYTNIGNEKLGKKNVKAITKAFSSAGVDGDNIDEGVVSVDMQSSRANVNGTVNCPNDTDAIFVSHTNGTTQQYTVSSDVPITLTVSKSNGEVVLSLPVFDKETFEIYPTGHDERYVVTIQAGSSYQKDATAVSAPIIPHTLAIQSLSGMAFWNNWFINTELAGYKLSIKQLEGNWNIEKADTVNGMLSKIMACYNTSNGARYISLFRFDELSNLTLDQYRQQFGSAGEPLIKTIAPYFSSQLFSVAAQSALVTYRTSNQLVKPMIKGFVKIFSEVTGESIVIPDQDIDKYVSNDSDKTIIAKTLFAIYSISGEWSGFRDSTEYNMKFNQLKNSKLILTAISSEFHKGKCYVFVDAKIETGGRIIISDKLRLVIGIFDDVMMEAPAVAGNDRVWITNILENMKDTFSVGSYLDFDLSGTEYIYAKSPIYFDWEGTPYSESSVAVQSNIEWDYESAQHGWCGITRNGNALSFNLGENLLDEREITIKLCGEDEMEEEVSSNIKIIQRDQYYDGGVWYPYNKKGTYKLYLTKKQAQNLYQLLDRALTEKLVDIIFGIDIDDPVNSYIEDKIKDKLVGYIKNKKVAGNYVKISGVDKFIKVMRLNGTIPDWGVLYQLRGAISDCSINDYVVIERKSLGGVTYKAFNSKIDSTGGIFTPKSRLDAEDYGELTKGKKYNP